MTCHHAQVDLALLPRDLLDVRGISIDRFANGEPGPAVAALWPDSAKTGFQHNV